MKYLLCYGDSNVWGMVPGTKNRYPWGTRWTSILQEKMKEDVRVIEEGLCGRTTMFEDSYRPNRNGLKALPLVLDSKGPVDGVVLMIGTNDCKTCYGLTAEQIASGIEKCVGEVLKVVPPEKILLISPIFLGDDVWREECDPEFSAVSVDVSKNLKNEYRKVAMNKKINFMAASDYAEADSRDCEHLNEDGHAKMADAIYTAIMQAGIIEQN